MQIVYVGGIDTWMVGYRPGVRSMLLPGDFNWGDIGIVFPCKLEDMEEVA